MTGAIVLTINAQCFNTDDIHAGGIFVVDDKGSADEKSHIDSGTSRSFVSG